MSHPERSKPPGQHPGAGRQYPGHHVPGPGHYAAPGQDRTGPGHYAAPGQRPAHLGGLGAHQGGLGAQAVVSEDMKFSLAGQFFI